MSYVLRSPYQHQGTPSAQLYCQWTSQCHRTNRKKVTRLSDYLSTRPNARIRFCAFGMVLNIHSGASYLSETRAHSHVACQLFFWIQISQGRAYCARWSNLYPLLYLKIFRGIRSRSWTWGPTPTEQQVSDHVVEGKGSIQFELPSANGNKVSSKWRRKFDNQSKWKEANSSMWQAVEEKWKAYQEARKTRVVCQEVE